MKKTATVLAIAFCFNCAQYLSAQQIFQKRIVESPNITNWDFVEENEQGFLVSGNDGSFRTVMQLDDNANTLWVKRYDQFSNFESNLFIASGADTITHVNYAGANISVFQTTNAGFLQGKSFTLGSGNFLLNAGQQLSDNRLAIAGFSPIENSVNDTYDEAAVLTLLDPDLNVVWSNSYYVYGYYLRPQYVAENATEYILIGEFGWQTLTFPIYSTPKIFALRINKVTGDAIGDVEVCETAVDLNLTSMSSNGRYLSGIHFDPGVDPHTGILIKINHNSSPIFGTSKSFQTPGKFSNLFFVEQSSEGDVYFGGRAGVIDISGGYSDGQYVLGKTNANLDDLIWAKTYSDTLFSGEYEDQGIARFCKIFDQTILTVGEYSGGGLGSNYIVTVDKDKGESSCAHLDLDADLVNRALDQSTLPVTSTPGAFSDIGAFTLLIGPSYPSFYSIQTVCFSALALPDDQSILHELLIYPNPTQNVLNIKLSAKYEKAGTITLKIYNATGQVISETTLTENENSIDVSDYSKGIYFLEISSSDTSSPQIMRKFTVY